ncbi:MAG: hypothetical protein ACI835_003237 [Planctomycetota bacterium]|jgi:hypothetical protein
MKFTIVTTALTCSLIASAASAQSISRPLLGGAQASSGFLNPFIWNQSSASLRKCQDPYMFMIGSSLANTEAVATICFDNAGDAIGTNGLTSKGSVMTDKGTMAAVRGEVSMDNYAGQAGKASGVLGQESGYYSAGALYGVYGSADAVKLDNYGSGSTSSSLGGSFLGGSDPTAAPLVFNASVGTWHIGGVRGTLRGEYNATPASGALAGVIGIDSSTGSAISYAGYFDGDVHVTGDVFGTTITPSSRRWKDQIETLEDPLETLGKLRGVSYRWVETGEDHIGFVAEEVAEVMPEVVSFEDDGETARGLDYGRMSALLVESVKAQQVLIERQDSQLTELQAQISQLREEMK